MWRRGVNFVNMNNIIQENWVTQQALANELNVSVQVVHNWVQRGKITAKKIEGSRLVLVDKTSVTVKQRNRMA